MASKKRPRRRRVRWDMQTWRECERTLNYDVEFDGTCSNPQIFADLVCGPIASAAGVMQVSGAMRGLSWGGAHLQIRYNSSVFASSEAPCSHAIKIVTALIKLPLLEDDVTPAYLPNLCVTRRQDSVVHSTQSDTDEDILWLWDEQLDLVNLSCFTGGGDPIECGADQLSCATPDDIPKWWFIQGGISQFGRAKHTMRLKSRRRLKEREALFLITEFVNGGSQTTGNVGLWPIRRNVYMRYAVRPIR